MEVGMAVEEKRESQVSEQMGYIDTNLSRLSEEIEKLDSRIEFIIKPDHIAPEKPINVAESLVPLASRLQDYTYRIDELVNRVRNLRDRVEL